jgi:PAS domain-containing protein
MYHCIAKGKVWHGEIKNRAKDGSTYWIDTTIVPSMNTEGRPRQYVAIRADITERKQAENVVKESLATSEAALKELADQKFALDQHAIVAVTDVQGTITYVNDRFCAISQYSKDELLGQNSPHPQLRPPFQKSFSSRCITISPAVQFGTARFRTAPRMARFTGWIRPSSRS